MLDGLADWVTRVVETVGYIGVAALVAIESVFPPIPSEIVLPLAGFVAGRGDASLIGMIVAATVGSVVGAWILYGIAAAIGRHRLLRFVERYGRWFGVGTDDVVRSEEWFDRRANFAVLVGRCVPLIRSLVSIPAGFRRMEPVRFTVLTAAGSAVWNTALIGAGAILGDRWEQVGDYVSILQYVVVIAIVLLLAWFAWKRLIQPRFGPREPEVFTDEVVEELVEGDPDEFDRDTFDDVTEPLADDPDSDTAAGLGDAGPGNRD